MGYNTVAVIYNDHLHRLAESGTYGADIARAIRHFSVRGRDPLATHFGVGMVISQAHADYSQVVIVGQNSGCLASEAVDVDSYALQQMTECLERHGYKVAKRRKPASESGETG